MKLINFKTFKNGSVYALQTKDGFPVEVTDTFLPHYTKDAIGLKQNCLTSDELGDRTERWMIGVSCMSGCPVRCKFCATGQLKRWRNLTAEEIVEQVNFVLAKNPTYKFNQAKEYKINYTRMGEPFLNLDAIKQAIEMIEEKFPETHHYVSTIGIKNSDFSWIKDNITLQLSLHSLNEFRRNELIPIKKKMTISELGEIKINSNLKIILNMTLVDEDDFDIDILRKYFDPERFFIKLSPINPNCVSEANKLGSGIIESVNLI